MANELEEDLNKKTKPKKVGNILVRVWDDGIVDARYTILDGGGRGAALKIPLDKKEFSEQSCNMGVGVTSLIGDLALPEHTNYPTDAGSEKPIIVGTASVDIYDDAKVVTIFTDIVRSEDRGAPRKNSTLNETEWKREMAKEVGDACETLKLTVTYVAAVSADEGDLCYDDIDDL